MSDNQKLIAAIVVGLMAMAKGCGNDGTTPVPPTPTVTVSQAFDDYRDLAAKVWQEGASQSFESDRAAFDWMKSHMEIARKAAFAPVHEREQATIGGDKYTDDGRKGLWTTFAVECK